MFMAFHSAPAHRVSLIVLFAVLLVVGGIVAFVTS
jgi:hypothetical protein